MSLWILGCPECWSIWKCGWCTRPPISGRLKCETCKSQVKQDRSLPVATTPPSGSEKP